MTSNKEKKAIAVKKNKSEKNITEESYSYLKYHSGEKNVKSQKLNIVELDELTFSAEMK